MHRRRLLAGVTGLSGLATLSGCSLFESEPTDTAAEPTTRGTARTVEPYTEPPVDRPDGRETPAATDEFDCLRRAVYVVNTADFDQYVTVAVDAVDSEASSVHSSSVRAGETLSTPPMAPAPGRYRATVDTADGRVGTGEFVVGEGTSALVVFAGADGIRFRQRATGWPDCPFVSTGGEAAEPPTLDAAIRQYGLQRVVVDNGGSEPTTARVSAVAADGSATLLDYGYRLPSGMRLDLPLLPTAPSYELTVATDAGRQRRRWDVETEPAVGFTVGDGVASSAGRPQREPPTPSSAVGSRLHHLVNDDNRPHAVTVTLRRGDRLLVAEGYNLAIGETVGLDVSLPTAADGRPVELAVSTADGATASVTWDVCPPAGTVVVAVDDRGLFRVYSDRTGILTG